MKKIHRTGSETSPRLKYGRFVDEAYVYSRTYGRDMEKPYSNWCGARYEWMGFELLDGVFGRGVGMLAPRETKLVAGKGTGIIVIESIEIEVQVPHGPGCLYINSLRVKR